MTGFGVTLASALRRRERNLTIAAVRRADGPDVAYALKSVRSTANRYERAKGGTVKLPSGRTVQGEPLLTEDDIRQQAALRAVLIIDSGESLGDGDDIVRRAYRRAADDMRYPYLRRSEQEAQAAHGTPDGPADRWGAIERGYHSETLSRFLEMRSPEHAGWFKGQGPVVGRSPEQRGAVDKPKYRAAVEMIESLAAGETYNHRTNRPYTLAEVVAVVAFVEWSMAEPPGSMTIPVADRYPVYAGEVLPGGQRTARRLTGDGAEARWIERDGYEDAGSDAHLDAIMSGAVADRQGVPYVRSSEVGR